MIYISVAYLLIGAVFGAAVSDVIEEDGGAAGQLKVTVFALLWPAAVVLAAVATARTRGRR